MIQSKKRAVSLMVSYVLLVVISLSLAVGVYAWLKWIAPPLGGPEKCPEDISLIIEEYSCNYKKITLSVKNNGLFNLDGFIARGTNEEDGSPNINLEGMQSGIPEEEKGRYDFLESLEPNGIESAEFSYSEINELRKIQIIPFRIQKDEKERSVFVLCSESSLIQAIEECT